MMLANRATALTEMAEAKLDVVGCGSMVVDLFYRTPRIINSDEKVILDANGQGPGGLAIEQASVGGVVLNHLGWAQLLGLRTGIFGKMGNDRNGEFLRDGMDSLGIKHHLTLDGSASSYATVFVDPAGNRAIYMMRGATAELSPAEVRARHGAFIRTARMVSTEISQLPLKTVIAILKLARERSAPTVVDLDIPPSDALKTLGTGAELEQALRLATYLKPAKGAAREVVGDGVEALAIAEEIRRRYGNRAVIMTDGAGGCAISARDTSVRVPAFDVKVVDTTGAGDAFLGAVMAGLRWGMRWNEIGRLANAAGAVCVGRLGAFPHGFELRDEILNLYGRPIPVAEAPKIKPGKSRASGAFNPETEVERFLEVSLEELTGLKRKIDVVAISRAADLIRSALAKGGRVHLTGVGKPEHVAHYGASLLCSVGTPATFLHATETLHGSLGQVSPRDVVIAISNSGNTSELCQAAMAIRDHGARLIAVTGNEDSELARLAHVVLRAPVKREGGVLGLAPRISVLAQVYVLAGLSVALEVAHGLTIEEYSRWHRAGTLGAEARRLAARRRRRGRLKLL
jgi:sugar/nucleoside kinase (ribokinase family)/D-arabinose 5-phosphate isomerase GutQ